MDWNSSFAISAAGMRVEQTRFDIAALNLANANSIASRGGEVFRPLSAVLGSSKRFALQIQNEQNLVAIPTPFVQAVVEQNVTPRRVLDPGNPNADDKGFVIMPGVNSTFEMLNIVTSLRAYESNVVAMLAAKSMAQKALEIGSGS